MQCTYIPAMMTSHLNLNKKRELLVSKDKNAQFPSPGHPISFSQENMININKHKSLVQQKGSVRFRVEMHSIE